MNMDRCIYYLRIHRKVIVVEEENGYIFIKTHLLFGNRGYVSSHRARNFLFPECNGKANDAVIHLHSFWQTLDVRAAEQCPRHQLICPIQFL